MANASTNRASGVPSCIRCTRKTFPRLAKELEYHAEADGQEMIVVAVPPCSQNVIESHRQRNRLIAVQEILPREADLEGVTMDPVTKDLYFCCEPNRVRKTTAPNYNTITKIFEVADAANFGNSGLEGITYYKDNVLYVGSQSGAYLWAYNVNGTMIWKKQLATIAPYIQEVGDLYYDPATDLLWISDSEAFKLFVFDGEVTKLKAMYDISFIGNPESVLVDHTRNCVWVGDDRGSSSRIYKISFTGLN